MMFSKNWRELHSLLQQIRVTILKTLLKTLPLMSFFDFLQFEITGREPAWVAGLAGESLIGADTVSETVRLGDDDVVYHHFAPAVALTVVDTEYLAYAVCLMTYG